MKKVREKDLKELIESFYCVFISHNSESDQAKLPYDEQVKVLVRSTHIMVLWTFDDSDSEIDMETYIKKFKEEIEKITFENLKVTYYEIEKFQYSSMVRMYIANAYELIEKKGEMLC